MQDQNPQDYPRHMMGLTPELSERIGTEFNEFGKTEGECAAEIQRLTNNVTYLRGPALTSPETANAVVDSFNDYLEGAA